MLRRQRRRAFVLLLALLAGCSSFSEADAPPSDGGVDASSGDAAVPSLDGPVVDAPTTPPPAYPIVLHFDANSGECGFWRGLHGATFTPIQNGSQGAGCTICGLGRDPTDGVPPFLRLSLVPEVGTYTFTGSFKLGEKPASVLSKLQIGFQISSESAPGQSALPGALQPVSPTDSWTPSMVVVPLTTLTAPDQSRVVLDATIELDPPSSGVSDECFDVDEITISFTPSQ